MLPNNAFRPVAVLPFPVVLLNSALEPIAVLSLPVTDQLPQHLSDRDKVYESREALREWLGEFRIGPLHAIG